MFPSIFGTSNVNSTLGAEQKEKPRAVLGEIDTNVVRPSECDERTADGLSTAKLIDRRVAAQKSHLAPQRAFSVFDLGQLANCGENDELCQNDGRATETSEAAHADDNDEAISMHAAPALSPLPNSAKISPAQQPPHSPESALDRSLSDLLFATRPLLARAGAAYFARPIFASLFARQFALMPKHRFMARQTDINLSMRHKLVDWLIEVADELRMRPETLCACVSLIDRFLSRMAVLRSKLQLVGTTALLICSKFEEIHPPEVKVFAYITENSYTVAEILKMEGIILRALKFDICVPTLAHFTSICNAFCPPCDADPARDTQIQNATDFLRELALLDSAKYAATHPPALVAIAAVVLARHWLDACPWPPALDRLVRSVGVAFDDCFGALRDLHGSLSSACVVRGAVWQKFASEERGCVAKRRLPETLPFVVRTSDEKCAHSAIADRF